MAKWCATWEANQGPLISSSVGIPLDHWFIPPIRNNTNVVEKQCAKFGQDHLFIWDVTWWFDCENHVD